MNKQKYKEILDEIKTRDGVLRPEAVVQDAKDENHPMHKEFEWDDSKCGEYWRVHQARMLINTIMVDVFDVGMAAYEVIVPSETSDRVKGYYGIQEIMSDTEMRTQVIKQALKLIKYWKEKYSKFKELESLINEDKLKELEDTVK